MRSVLRLLMVVLDASVILGWCRQDDPHYKLAIRFYEAFADGLLDIAVPSLFFFEAASAMAAWNWPIDSRDRILRDLLRMKLSVFRESRKLLRATMQVMDAYGLRMRDASYLALGLTKGWPVVTADRQAWRRARRIGTLHYLSDISDLRPYYG